MAHLRIAGYTHDDCFKLRLAAEFEPRAEPLAIPDILLKLERTRLVRAKPQWRGMTIPDYG